MTDKPTIICVAITGSLPQKSDMASLSVGSVNFPNRTYDNPPNLVDWLASELRVHDVTPDIEAFDVSHVLNAISMYEAGVLPDKLYVQIVMGVRNAMPSDREVFDFMVDLIETRAPAAEWCAAGIGPNQIVLNQWAAERGAHLRTGLEDNLRLDRKILAPSNAELVRRAARAVETTGRKVATPQEARRMLNLNPI